MPPKDVHVQVYIEPNANPNFRLTSTDLPIGPDGQLIFRNCHHDGFHVHFDLQDPTHGYLFPPNNQDAVYSAMGSLTTCPTANPSDPKNQVFRSSNVTPNRRTLRVHNPNQGSVVGEFGYALRVIDSAGQPLILDPGGDNMNGPISRFFEASAILIGIGGAIATTLVLAGLAYLAGLQLVFRF